MRSLVFCENRNHVRLLRALVRADPDVEWLLGTTLDGTAVGEWVTSEVGAVDDDLDVVDLAGGRGVDAQQLAVGVADEVARLAIDRVVIFNDRSQRGRVVAEATSGQVPRVLVQDGHLDFWFVEDGPSQQDQNARWGGGEPDAICVWGPSMEAFLASRHESLDAPVIVSGAIGVSDDDVFVAAARNLARVERERIELPRVLLFDQPLSDQSKMPAAAYRSQVDGLLASLSGVASVTVKPHPSSSTSHLDWWEQRDDAELLDHASKLDDATVAEFDVALTFFSSSYIDTVRAGVPLVVHRLDQLNVVLPDILHPLLRRTSSPRELVEVVTHLSATGHFVANDAGQPIDHFIALDTRPADVIVEAIRGAEIVDRHDARSPAPPPAETTPEPARTRRAAALARVERRAAHPQRVVVLGDDFAHGTGVAVSVHAYARWLVARHDAGVRFVDLRAVRDSRSIVEVVGDADVVVLNSFAALWRQPGALDCVRALLDIGHQVALYAHETDLVFQNEATARGARHRAVLELLPRLRLLCVSERQVTMLRGLGARDCRLVYEATDAVVAERRRPDDGVVRILMVGSIQNRKGPDLFSRLAERAALDGRPWEFRWVGHRVPRLLDGALLSERVTWTGPVDQRRVSRELADADVFLLSSIDDPQPLSVIEAVRQRLRVVTFDGVGSAEVLDGIDGYRSFSTYSTDAAYAALDAVLATEIDHHAYDEVIDLVSLDAFAERMSAALRNDFGRDPRPGFLDTVSATDVGVETRRFTDLMKDGNDDRALALGDVILRRRASWIVAVGMASILRRQGRYADALSYLGVAGLHQRRRPEVWRRIALEATEMNDTALAVLAATVADRLGDDPGARRIRTELLRRAATRRIRRGR